MTALLSNLWNRDNSVPLKVDEAVSAIQNSRRRHVVLLLDDQDGMMTVGELAEGVASIELDKEIPELTTEERKRIYISMYQLHLQTLDETGVVAYHDREKNVYPTELTAGVADIVRHLESVCSTDVGD